MSLCFFGRIGLRAKAAVSRISESNHRRAGASPDGDGVWRQRGALCIYLRTNEVYGITVNYTARSWTPTILRLLTF